MLATDGKLRETDCAKAATLLRIVQSVPSPKADPHGYPAPGRRLATADFGGE